MSTRAGRLSFLISLFFLLLVAPAARAQLDLGERIPDADDASGIGLPVPGDDEICDDTDESNDAGTLDCLITTAMADLDSGIPTLSLEGSFCEQPLVSIGRESGELNELLILSASESFITLDLGSHDPGTFLVIVECPCETCVMDVTLGNTGPVGPTGPEGAPGSTGPPGATGAQGEQGTQGEAGPTGAQGDVGPTGAQGVQGDVGPTGAQGVQGDVGPTGAQGVQGDVGPTGAQGVQGDAGPTGAQGVQGDAGPTGAQGVQGDAGPTGAQGVQGDVGPTGAQGVQGDAGPTGAQGVQGDVGPTGAQGVQGDAGPTGAQGVQGDVGPTGAQGVQGDVGPTGAQGVQGDAGPTGAQGVQGDAGPTGAQGVQGDAGPTGAQGPPGDPGSQGATGPQGPSGPTGPAAPGPADPACYDNANRFVDCGNGTVTDSVTGLIWLGQADCLGAAAYSAANGLALTLADGQCGLTDGSSPGDWRLPTKQEWARMVNQSQSNGCTGPYIPDTFGLGCWSEGDPFTGVLADVYWAATSSAGNPLVAWSSDLNAGALNGANKSSVQFVWPVRVGEPDFFPDLGGGTNCLETSECDAGLTCVDDLCCASECSGTCQACDLPGTEGTCTDHADGTDPENECGDVSCSGFLFGWIGDTCYEVADVSANDASCGGDGDCRSASEECPSSGPGPATLTCDSLCQDPNLSTCTETTAGACDDVDMGSQTCGIGACQVSVPQCVNGSPNACVPGTPTAEVCNGIDDDCNGTTDDPGAIGSVSFYFDGDGDGYGIGAPQQLCTPSGQFTATIPGDCDDSDSSVNPGATEVCNGIDDNCDGAVDEGFQEPPGGDTCIDPIDLGTLTGDGVLIMSDTVWPAGDQDWYTFSIAESDPDCFCCDASCTFEGYLWSFDISGGGFEYEVFTTGCGNLECLTSSANCSTNGPTPCSLDVPITEFFVRVARQAGNPPSCEDTYQLQFTFTENNCDGFPCDNPVCNACTSGGDCDSGLCVDDQCCESACDGLCQTCDDSGSVGSCTNIPLGDDPDNECPGAQVCDGAGGCSALLNQGDPCTVDNECFSGFCTDGVCCQSACDGNCESCDEPGSVGSCTNLPLGADPDNECPGAQVCDGAGGCAAVLNLGDPCGSGPECISGFCTDGVCCNSTCSESCETCNLGGSQGTCTGLPGVEDPGEPGSGATCGGAVNLGTLGSDQGTTIFKTLYPGGDVDWFRIRGDESDATCANCDGFFSDEDYRLWITLTVPPGAGTYRLRAYEGSCGSLKGSTTASNGGSSTFWVPVDGSCFSDDVYDFWIEVVGLGGPGFSCQDYSVEFFFDAQFCF